MKPSDGLPRSREEAVKSESWDLLPLRSDKKRVEYNELRHYKPANLVLWFQTYPIWLLSLKHLNVGSIRLPQFKDWNSLFHHVRTVKGSEPMLHAALNDLGRSKVFFQDVAPGITELGLVSGAIEFINRYLVDTPGIGVTDYFVRGRRLPASAVPLFQLRHHLCGGITNFSVLWCSNLAHSLTVRKTRLRRTIEHVFDYSQRPAPAAAVPTGALTNKDILPIHRLQEEIYYPSDFVGTPFGRRQLTLKELGTAWNIPITWMKEVRDLSCLPPLPLLLCDVLLLSWVDSQKGDSIVRDVGARLRVPPPVCDDGGVWLPTLNRVLPNTWRSKGLEYLVSAKADDAPIEYDMWNFRIVPLFPHLSVKFLDRFRTLLHRQRMRRMFLEFVRYMWRTYPVSYPGWLRAKSALCAGSTACPPKRVRGRVPRQQGGSLVRSGISESLFDTLALAIAKSNPNPVEMKEMRLDIKAGTQVLYQYCNATFWDWSYGSTLVFWRWPPDFRREARDGVRIHVSSPLPTNMNAPRRCPKHLQCQIWTKIRKFLERRYINLKSQSEVKNVTHFFGVPKGENDIRIVFNGTDSGLTDAIWAPSFWLPNASSMLRAFSFGHKPVDMDLGEFFINLPLDPALRPYSAVDLTIFRELISTELPHLLKGLEGEKRVFGCWERTWMGLKPSPVIAAKSYYIAEEFVRGREDDPCNPFFWDTLVLNAIGNEDFNPSLPWVFKFDSKRNLVAGDLRAYVDDLRSVGWSLEHAWQFARVTASPLQYLGIQDAPRKRRIDAGPWAGTVYSVTKEDVGVTVTQQKWAKGRDYIQRLIQLTRWDPSEHSFSMEQAFPKVYLSYKLLEQMRGYLCHLAMTFPIIFPYLKGFHLTLASHLDNRDSGGWKINDLELLGHMEALKEKGLVSNVEVMENKKRSGFSHIRPPEKILLVPRFFLCLKALWALFDQSDPPKWSCRKRHIAFLVYGFNDASKSGLGVTKSWDDKLTVTMGTWGSDAEDESSNWRELGNLVEDLEAEEPTGRLNDSWLVFATDNATSESCLYKGNSSSEKLYDLVVRLRALELRTGARLLVTHCSGRRMIHQGTDGLSRGSLQDGVCLSKAMLAYCPWGKSGGERSPLLIDWILDWFGNSAEVLAPKDWYHRGHDLDGYHQDDAGLWRPRVRSGLLVWDLPPVAAAAALEELRKARTKRTKSTHLIIVPKIFTPLWLKQLHKAADVVMFVPACFNFWNSSMFEPLCIGLCFPYLPFRPWELRRTPKLLQTAREVHRLCKEDQLDPGPVLHKLVKFTRRLPSMPEHEVWAVLYFRKQR